MRTQRRDRLGMAKLAKSQRGRLDPAQRLQLLRQFQTLLKSMVDVGRKIEKAVNVSGRFYEVPGKGRIVWGRHVVDVGWKRKNDKVVLLAQPMFGEVFEISNPEDPQSTSGLLKVLTGKAGSEPIHRSLRRLVRIGG